MQTIKQWLEQVGLAQYAQVFADNDVDLEALRLLAESDLEKLGISLGNRKKLLSALARLDSARAADTADKSPHPQSHPAEAERRQLSVMFCDLVGSTSLSEQLDPEELRQVVRAYQHAGADVVASFEGHIAQYLGDGLLVYFGHPRAHEDDAQRAVRASLGILAAMSELNARRIAPVPLSVRIGIHTGVVVVGDIGAGGRHEQLALGDTPNIAARLQALAEPDTVVISERMRQLVRGSFRYQDLGSRSLKGISEPVHAWRIVGVSEAESRFEAATQSAVTPLIGRELEMQTLLARWRVSREGTGQVVMLSGEPGIGKSRILSALREHLDAEVQTLLGFQCSAYYSNSAFYPLIEHLERTLKLARDESPDSKLDKLARLLTDTYARPATDVRLFASILSIPCSERNPSLSITPQKQKDDTIRALVDLIEAAARRRRCLMLFEDAHWADPTTLEVLDLLIDRVRDFPLLVVITHRPDLEPGWTHHGHVATLSLLRLSSAQSSALVSRVAGDKQLPRELVDRIAARSDGVPLFAEELTKAVLESDVLKQTGDRYEYLDPAVSVAIPATLRDSLMARLDRFTSLKEIAQIGAAIGREFSYELISAVAPIDKEQLDAALARLTESGLAFRAGAIPDAVFTFKHALVRDAAYDTLLKTRRKALHGAIARTLEERFASMADAEPELLAYHFTEAAQIDVAVRYWCKAGELALRRMAPKEAISHLTRGLDLVATLPPTQERDGCELDLRVPLGAAWMALRGWHAQAVASSLTPALQLATSLHRREAMLPVLTGLWVNRMTQGRDAESLQFAEQMLTEAEVGEDSKLRTVGHMAAMASGWWVGNFVVSKQHAAKVLELYDPQAHRPIADSINYDPKTMAHMYNAASAWMLGYADTAVHEMKAMEAHARWRGHPFDLLVAVTFGSIPFHYRGDLAEFHGRLDAAKAIAREQGLAFFGEVYAPWLAGFTLGQEGRHQEAVAALSSGIETWTELGLLGLLPYAKRLLAESLAATGAHHQAIEMLDASLDQIAQPGWEERVHLAEVLRVRGVILDQLGKPEEAERDLRNAIDVARNQQAKSWELRAAMSLAGIWSKCGKQGEAHALLASVYSWFTEGFETRDLKEARKLLVSEEGGAPCSDPRYLH